MKRDPPSLRWWLGAGSFFALYVVAGRASLAWLTFLNASASPLWPPTGIALAALLLLGLRAWPLVLVGAFLVNLATTASPLTDAVIAAGNTLEAVAAAALVQRFAGGVRAMDRPADLAKFFAVGILAPVISATIGVTALVLGGFAAWADFSWIWLTWWLGDAVGAIAIAPAILLWTTRGLDGMTRRRGWEGAALVLVIGAVGLWVFTGAPQANAAPTALLVLPPLVWATFRLGRRETSAAILYISCLAVWGTLNGVGPFARPDANDSLLNASAGTAVLALTLLPLAVVLAEQRHAVDSLRRGSSEAGHRLAANTQTLSETVEALQRQVELNQSLIEAQAEIGDGVSITEGQRIVYVNEALCRMYGYSEAELMAMPSFLQIVVPEDRERLTARLRSRMAGKEMGDRGETTVIRKDGRRLHIEYAVKLVWRGESSRLFSIVRDISERRTAEDELRRSQERFSKAFQASPVAMAITTRAEGRHVEVNEAFVKTYGYTREEVIGRTSTEIGLWTDPDARQRILRLLEEEGSVRGLEIRVRGKSGELRDVLSSLEPVDFDGRPCILALGIDVTERKKAETDRAARLAQLTELERLKELDTFKTQFINTAAHELSTPLTPIRVQLHMLRERPEIRNSADAQHAFEVLDRNVERVIGLVHDILDAGRLQAARLGVQRKPADLRNLVREAGDSFQAAAKEAGVRLETKASEPLPVRVDAQRISQVLYNLLSNALKFTPRDGTITLEARLFAGSALVAVRDTGRGLAADHIARLFQPFSQVVEGAAAAQGAGLGLFISKGILDLHDGRIWCESPGLGRGSTFFVSLPLLEAEDPRLVTVERVSQPAATLF